MTGNAYVRRRARRQAERETALGGETLVRAKCRHCGRAFRVAPSRFKHGRGKSCSPACQYAARRAEPRTGRTFRCRSCGAPVYRPPSRIRLHKGTGKYCSRVCRDGHRIRANHPQYIASDKRTDRGPNWQAQKRKARRRDRYRCQDCGRRGTDVHHKRPFRLFDDYRIANRLRNLITLCRPCHRKADARLQAREARRVAH